MRADRPSFTAAWVAAARALGARLPPEARLADDPYGLRFARAHPLVRTIARAGLVPPMRAFVLYMQLRTRAIDDVCRELARSAAAAGQRAQIVLLGAGYDCRAARFARELGDGVVFEVDHPATQAHKRAALGDVAGARVEYVEWHFEERPMDALPDALAARGHDRAAPTLTIWEGVTMYLTEPAIDATVRAVHAFSAPRSLLCFTYFERALHERPPIAQRALAAIVKRVGEPFTFGWRPEELASWFAARGFALEWDRDARTIAAQHLPAHWQARVDFPGRHVALARVA
jgi:methyltransferase (TIGR00027 family)